MESIKTYPLFAESANRAKRLLERYTDIRANFGDFESHTFSSLKALVTHEAVAIIDWTETPSLFSHGVNSEETEKQILVNYVDSSKLAYALQHVPGNMTFLVIFGEQNEDIPFETYGCMSCVSTKNELNWSVERLLVRQLFAFIRSLTLNLHYNLQLQRTRE